MSRSAFAERFSAVLGRPPIEFLKEVRLRRAAQLLEMTDLPVKVVAGSVGYSSRSYFSRAFKELYGTYPANFRARGSG
jgi:AraC-like DNA-binding protein